MNIRNDNLIFIVIVALFSCASCAYAELGSLIEARASCLEGFTGRSNWTPLESPPANASELRKVAYGDLGPDDLREPHELWFRNDEGSFLICTLVQYSSTCGRTRAIVWSEQDRWLSTPLDILICD